MPTANSRIRWPDRRCWVAFFRYGALLSVLWIVVYGGADWITSLHNYRVPLHLEAELHIPFVPAAAVIYLSLFPLLWLAPFLLETEAYLASFAKALTRLFVTSGVGLLLLPGEEVRTQTADSNFFGQVYEFADWINLSHNYLPSLHVGMAVFCAAIYSRTASQRIATILWLWAAAIALSTLFMHQHYVADLAAGGALGYVIAKSACRSDYARG